MERHIIHLDIAAFGVAVEEVREPRLRGRPVVIGVPGAARAAVRCASIEAYRAGIRKGMPLAHARRWCRDLVVIPPNEILYRAASRSVYEVLGEFSPLVEPSSYGHLFIDITGTRRLFGEPRDVAARMRREISSRLSLRGTVGIASNKLVSRVAARIIQPDGDVCDVEHGGEAAFLAPLTVRVLPELKQDTEEVLVEELNIRLIRQLAVIPIGYLTVVFGRVAYVLHRQALGIDPTPVRPPQRRPAIVEEGFLAEDTNDDRHLLAELYAMSERAAHRLRKGGVVARRLTLTLRYADHVERVRRTRLDGRGQGSGRSRGDGRPRLDRAGFDERTTLDMYLFRHVESLFFQACDRRQRVRHLSIQLTDLIVRTRQLDLFGCTGENRAARSSGREGVQRDRELVAAIDRIREKYGGEAIRMGRVL